MGGIAGLLARVSRRGVVVLGCVSMRDGVALASVSIRGIAGLLAGVSMRGVVLGCVSMRGDVVVINYWASWCAPCRAEMLALDQFMREKAGKGLRIYAVNIESSPPEKAMRDLSGALSFPVGRRLAGKGYGKIDNAVPTNFVIDRKGVVRHAKAGAFSYDSFARLLNPLLAEARPVEVA